MSEIRFENVSKVFDGNIAALQEFSLKIPSPRLVVLVGPSGCGKTTLLRLIAGLERPTSGEIYLGDDRLDTKDVRSRDVAMVFQNYALYPHMTVRGNLSFGLRIRKVPKETIAARVKEVSKSLEIDTLLDRRPAQLSGGQRQRVALGRAIIREPRVFLFDEPLSNLDARLRDEMRYLIRRLYQRLKTSTIYVTHDQVEAMTIGEMLVVLKDGRIHQVGSPSECYERPGDTFVASFLGSPPMNLIDGTFEAASGKVRLDTGTEFAVAAGVADAIGAERGIVVGIRPEAFGTSPPDGVGLAFAGRISLRETLGHDVLTHVDLGGREIIARGCDPGEAGSDCTVYTSPDAVHFFEKRSGTRIVARERTAEGQV
ncbi:MAG: sn-glycerol-3-phosphate ABC transporter ATP-binding protein UgpC [bacterium]|nr:sn-glycerol-3-phosphate ABC transporter ATP-binding protein UgpC [bacterium]